MLSSPRRSRFGAALVLALIGVVVRPDLPVPTVTDAAARKQGPTDRVQKQTLVGASARTFLLQRAESNSKLRERLSDPRIHHSRDFANLRVRSIKIERPRAGLWTVITAAILGTPVMAAGRDDCEELLLTGLAAPYASRLLRTIDCQDIEEVNIYSDNFESGIHAAGTIGVSYAMEVLGEGISEYDEAEIEVKVDIQDNQDGTYEIDPAYVSLAAQDPASWIAANIWWIFSDPGYGSSDQFADSGIPCDQWEDIKGWINNEVKEAVFSWRDMITSTVGGIIECAPTALTGFGFAVCATAATAANLALDMMVRTTTHLAHYYLDCKLDIIAPSPARFRSPVGVPKLTFVQHTSQ